MNLNNNNENLFERFLASFPDDPGQTLLTTANGNVYTYGDALDDSGRMARCLSDLGLKRGDRVTVQAKKSPEVLWLYLACLRGGFVFHPLDMSYQLDELVFFVNNAKPAVVVCDPDKQQLFHELVQNGACAVLTLDAHGNGSMADAIAETPAPFRTRERHADDTAVLLYSSGTTGVPKGIKLTHGNLIANTQALVQAWAFTADDVLLHALPLYHAHGLLVATGCALLSGAAMIFVPHFENDHLINNIARCSVMMGVPDYYARLLDDKRFNTELCANIRLFISGSTPLSREMFTEFETRTGHRIVERYGTTETGINTSNPLDGERRPGSVGTALPGVELRVADSAGNAVPHGQTGHLQVRGPHVFSGYWHRSEAVDEDAMPDFTADGFFNTGDTALIEADGYMKIVNHDSEKKSPESIAAETDPR